MKSKNRDINVSANCKMPDFDTVSDAQHIIFELAMALLQRMCP